jgi:hypothetical protein
MGVNGCDTAPTGGEVTSHATLPGAYRRPVRYVAALALALTFGCSNGSDSPAPAVTATTARSGAVTGEPVEPARVTIGSSGIEVETPSGWSVESSTGETLYLRDDSGAELNILVQPNPSGALPVDEVLSTVSAFGDDSAVITDVEGGYALYAALDCPAEPCERIAAFAYNLSLAAFSELSSSL